ncbi:ATP-binding cassette domain-containing protein [uncultured Desulfobacter sp.]|uniref:ABC transporter ATP-binding protein n=1 Tax=uncultured Desulfobacter sp. TaxID=240139 RepID=UPI0029F4A3A5|nr:ATP-binding cassette domain-containing protein [uncultured Desulfobacter sp.]
MTVRFDGVTFGYESRNENALTDVNFVIEPGTATALVGPSGAGKSTVARLLPRFWDVTKGAITIGGIDIRQMDNEVLMNTVTFVFQDTFLFHDTLAYTMQGLAYLSIYGVMAALFSSFAGAGAWHAWSWLGLMAIFVLINVFARWFAHDFEYTDITANITHNLRAKLGKKLRTMPLAIPLYHRKRKSGIREKTKKVQANSALESDIIEYIQGLAVLRTTNQTGKKAQRLYKGIINVRDLQCSSIWGTMVNMVMADMLILFALVVIAILGCFWVGNGTMGIAAIASLLVIISRLMEPLSLFLAVTSVVDTMSAGFTRVKTILEKSPLKVVSPQSKAKGFEIVFNNVEFTYHGQREKALKKCTIKIPGQAMTAIVGPSGSGKTTITRLMMRYADPQTGLIMIGGTNIRQISQKELESYFAVVFQDVYLFDDSIMENIRMAKSGATDAQVIQAAKAACCHEFIKRLPDGYYTTVGDIGGSLSGGERQRISIARAILKDAPIVILDEPTAALDTESEVAVQKAIEKLVRNKTVIVVAHRLSTIAGADQILVIDDGMLIESGTYDSLLEKHGKYHALWQAQLNNKKWHIVR